MKDETFSDGDMEITRQRMSKGEMPKFTAALSDSLVPRYVFIMKTAHKPSDVTGNLRAGAEKMVDKIAEGAPIPADIREIMITKLIELKQAHLVTNPLATFDEWHTIAVLENTDTGAALVVVNSATNKKGTIQCDPAGIMHDAADGKDEMLTLTASVKLSGIAMRYAPDWKGTRIDMKEVDRPTGTLAEMLEAIDATGYGVQFRAMLMPAVTAKTAPATPASTATPAADAKAQRAALVARFGERNVKALEKKIKAGKQQ